MCTIIIIQPEICDLRTCHDAEVNQNCFIAIYTHSKTQNCWT